jgi:hypothetical protein
LVIFKSFALKQPDVPKLVKVQLRLNSFIPVSPCALPVNYHPGIRYFGSAEDEFTHPEAAKTVSALGSKLKAISKFVSAGKKKARAKAIKATTLPTEKSPTKVGAPQVGPPQPLRADTDADVDTDADEDSDTDQHVGATREGSIDFGATGGVSVDVSLPLLHLVFLCERPSLSIAPNGRAPDQVRSCCGTDGERRHRLKAFSQTDTG